MIPRNLTILLGLWAIGTLLALPPANAAPAASTPDGSRYPGFRRELRQADAVLRLFVQRVEPRSGAGTDPETRAWQEVDVAGIVVSILKGNGFTVGDTLRFSVRAPEHDREAGGELRSRFGGFYHASPRSGREAVFLLRRDTTGFEATRTVCMLPAPLAARNGRPGQDARSERARAADDRFVTDYLSLAGEADDAALVGLTRAIFGGLLDAGEPDSARVRLLMYDWAMLSSLERRNDPAIRQVAEEYRAQLLSRARRDGDPFLIAWMAGFLPAEQRKAIVKAMLDRLAALDHDPPADDPPPGAAAIGAGGPAGGTSAAGLASYAIEALIDPGQLDYQSPDFVSDLVARSARPDSILSEARAFARR